MKEEHFTPEQGFETITSVIREAKAQFEEDGIVYVAWGLLAAIASFTQYYLIHNGHAHISYYPYFMMPVGGVLTAIYYAMKGNKARTHLSRIMAATWAPLSISIIVIAFAMGGELGDNLIPLILILLSIGVMISGATINSNILLYSGILMNFIGFYSFVVDYSQQPLLMGIASIVCFLAPGVLLMRNHKKNNV